jgi:ribosome modulation factor
VKILITWLFPICFWAWNFTIFCLDYIINRTLHGGLKIWLLSSRVTYHEQLTWVLSWFDFPKMIPYSKCSSIVVLVSKYDRIFLHQLKIEYLKFYAYSFVSVFYQIQWNKYIWNLYLQINCLSFYWNQLWPPRHACLASLGDKTARVYASQKTGIGLQVWLSGWRQSRTRSQVRCWTCERAYSGYEIGLEVAFQFRYTNSSWRGDVAGLIQRTRMLCLYSLWNVRISSVVFPEIIRGNMLCKAGKFCTCGIRKIEKVGIMEKRFGK